MRVPERWHLTPAQVRYFCGSPERIKLAGPEEPRRQAPEALRLASLGEIVTAHAAINRPRRASGTAKAQLLALIQREGEVTRVDLVRETGWSLERVIELTKEMDREGSIRRLRDCAGRPIVYAPSHGEAVTTARA